MLKALIEFIRLVPFLVPFGWNGTDFQKGGRGGGKKRKYINWMAYDLFREHLTVQLTTGRTTYMYEVFGVTPRMYLKLRRKPSPEAFQVLFIHDDTHVYTAQWRWRYDGAYSNRHIKRRTA